MGVDVRAPPGDSLVVSGAANAVEERREEGGGKTEELGSEILQVCMGRIKYFLFSAFVNVRLYASNRAVDVTNSATLA